MEETGKVDFKTYRDPPPEIISVDDDKEETLDDPMEIDFVRDSEVAMAYRGPTRFPFLLKISLYAPYFRMFHANQILNLASTDPPILYNYDYIYNYDYFKSHQWCSTPPLSKFT